MFGFRTKKDVALEQAHAALLIGIRNLQRERDALKTRVAVLERDATGLGDRIAELTAEVERRDAAVTDAPSFEPGVIVDGTHTPQRVFIDGHEIYNVVSVTNSNEAGEVSRTTIVLHGTYSVRKRAVEPKPGEWIEWAGGECPVPPGTKVDVKFRSEGQFAKNVEAEAFTWVRHGSAGDIVAYRVAP